MRTKPHQKQKPQKKRAYKPRAVPPATVGEALADQEFVQALKKLSAEARPAYVMPICPTSGKPVNLCQCDDCPIPF